MKALSVVVILLLSIQAQSAELSFWSGKIGNAGIKLFITGAAFPDNYTPGSDAEKQFYARHKNGVYAYYFYDKYKKDIALVGTMLDGRWRFEEYGGSVCINCKPNGYFDGSIKDDTVSGFWISADSSKRFPLRIENAPLQKKTVFGWLRGGEWVLDNAEGFYGANTMTGLSKDEKGRWSAGGSSISAGMREGYESDLTKEDIKLLDGIRILVTDSLAIVIKIGTRTILRVPYTENPFVTLEKITPETDGIGRIHEYNKKPALTISSINVATTDIGEFDETFQIDALPYDTPSAAHIEYIIQGDLFRVTLVSADCCASQDLTFKRRVVK